MRLPAFIKLKIKSMQHILFIYMLILAFILSSVIFAGFYFFSKYNYNNFPTVNIVFFLLFIIVTVLCCNILSKLYLSPIIKNIEELSELLEEKDKQLSVAYSKLDRISSSVKTEIDPDDYEYFKTGLKTLTPSERKIFDFYLSGKSSHEILELSGIKERTLKFHNSNIYSKLGVQSRKELLKFAAVYEEKNNN